MKIKSILILGVFISILTSILFAQNNLTSNKYSNIKGWENKLHIKPSNKPSLINKQELINVSKHISSYLNKKCLGKTKLLQKESSLKNILEKKNRKSIIPNSKSLNNKVYNNWKILWNSLNNTPTHISNFNNGMVLSKSNLNISSVKNAVSFIDMNKEVFKLNKPSEELVLVEEIEDELSKKHIKFSQQYKGIPIWGNEITLHTNTGGNIYLINARYSQTPTRLDVDSKTITNNKAIEITKRHILKSKKIVEIDKQFKKIFKYSSPTSKKYIWLDENQIEYLVWFVQVRPNLIDNLYYFVDANSGKILQHYNATAYDGPATASAIDLNDISRDLNVYEMSGQYYMIDGSKDMWLANQTNIIDDPKGAILTIDVRQKDLTNDAKLFHVTSNNNSWNDRTSVSAHYNGGITYEYYKNVHNRNAIDGKGSTILSIVHATDEGTSMDNAYWNGAMMIYGDGNVAFKPLAGALDVAGHEMTHGVIQHTVGLEYKFQSGALNESLADVFGAMVDKTNWLLGEDVTNTTYIASGALRNMEDPHNGGNSISDNGWQPANMDEYLELNIDQDNGGVHINSGIPNRACALIGNLIGKGKTERIYYRVMNARYLNSKSQFIDMRLAVIHATEDLYGENEVSAVKQAFDIVGILDGSGTEHPNDLPAVEGKEWIAVINAENEDESLYLVNPNDGSDYQQLTKTQIYSSTGNPISISDDGSAILFIDSEKYMKIIASDGSSEERLHSDSVWKSIALSPDGKKLAATTKWEDGLIYIFDLENSDNSKAIKLYNPTTQEGIKDSVVKYADAIDWNLSSELIIYDSFNEVPKATGSAIQYWTINILDVENEKIYSIFAPQEEGISLGNPSFGQTNDNYLLIDKIDYNIGTDTIFAVDLFSGKIGLVEANGSSIGYPRYSPNDEHVVFQRIEDGVLNLRQIPMTENKISSSDVSRTYVSGGQSPSWFAIGSRPVDVEKETTTTLDYKLYQNYPNPFNPTTTIKYTLPIVKRLGKSFYNVKLKVYDILGNEIATLVDAEKSSGNYIASFNAENLSSGVYYYQLKTESFITTKKMIIMK